MTLQGILQPEMKGLQFLLSQTLELPFKNCVSYIQDGRTGTLQMLLFIYVFHQI
jgi:hypothetical protein